MIFWLAILATVLFLASSVWMVRDAYRVVKGTGRPSVLSIIAFVSTGELMAILWLMAGGEK